MMHMNSFEMMLFIMSLISIGTLIGITFELLNYRRDIRDHIGYIEEVRVEVTTNVVKNIDRLEQMESKIDGLQMVVNNKG